MLHHHCVAANGHAAGGQWYLHCKTAVQELGYSWWPDPTGRVTSLTEVSLYLQRLLFDIPVFHPLVDPTSGELDVKRAFAKWRLVHQCVLWWRGRGNKPQ